MKLEPTPKEQREHNDDIHRRLRVALAFAALVVIFAITLEASLTSPRDPQPRTNHNRPRRHGASPGNRGHPGTRDHKR